MALTYGFYNSQNGDRKYDAEQIGSIFDGIINDGIYQTIGDAMTVKASSGMTVNVSPGRAWFNHTWTVIDALYPVTLSTAPVGKSRYDAVILQIEKNASGRANSIKVIEGTTAVSPTKPTVSHDTTNKIYRYPLAYVYIGAGVTAITQTNIENAVGTSATPFVSGVLEHIDTGTLTTQWAAEFEEMIAAKEDDFDTLLEDLRTQTSQVTSKTVIDGSVTNEKLALKAVETDKIADGAVTRKKCSTEVLYSPNVFPLENDTVDQNPWAITAADIGKTLISALFSTEMVFTLTQAVSETLPLGTEIAFVYFVGTGITFRGTGIRMVHPEVDVYTKIGFRVATMYNLVAIKKLTTKDKNGGDVWLVIGDVEELP